MRGLRAGKSFLPICPCPRTGRQLAASWTTAMAPKRMIWIVASMLGIATTLGGCEGTGSAVPGPNNVEYYVLIGRLNQQLSMPGGSQCGATAVSKDRSTLETAIIGSIWTPVTSKELHVYDVTKRIGPFAGIQQVYVAMKTAGWVVPVSNAFYVQDYFAADAGC
jgi:hypothetical protein